MPDSSLVGTALFPEIVRTVCNLVSTAPSAVGPRDYLNYRRAACLTAEFWGKVGRGSTSARNLSWNGRDAVPPISNAALEIRRHHGCSYHQGSVNCLRKLAVERYKTLAIL
jgi:hypothetical protein